MDSIGVKRALLKGGLFAMGMMIGTGFLFGIEINDEKKIDLASVDGLRILVSSAELRIIESESEGKARLRLYGKAPQRVSLGLETIDGIVQARVKRPWKIPALERLFLDVYLPAGYGKSLELRTTSGKIRGGYFEFAVLSLETNSGGIEWEGAKAEKVIAKATSGKVKIGKVDAESLKLLSTSGSISIEECASPDAVIRVTSGKISIESLFGNIDARSSSGDIAIRYPEYRGWNATAKASSGKVVFRLPPDARFTLETKSGSGKTTSDFGGGASAPGAGTISVMTSSGRIDIRKN